MIRRLHLENFKCLRDVTIDFAPLTVLIGPNDSGKSSILEALHWIWQRSVDKAYSMLVAPIGEPANPLVWRRDNTKRIKWATNPGEAFATTDIYKLEPAQMRMPSAPHPEPVLSANGANLATVLEALMTGPDRQALRGLEDTLYRTIPTLKSITVPTIKGPLKALEFVLAGSERPPIKIPAAQVSDGALLLTAYLALVYSDTPEIILIEEPENGLHPSRLKMIVDILRQVTTGDVGNRKRQIIMTTHSPLLLNYCQPEEVRIVKRGEDGGSQVTPLLDVPDIQRLLSEFALGELWFMLTEEGLLRGGKA